MRRSLTLAATLLVALCGAPRAQQAAHDVSAIARALLAGIAPEKDDPDATVAALLAAAGAHGRSPAAALLVAESQRWIGLIQRPAPLLATVTSLLAARQHGLVRQELLGMQWRLQRAVHGDATVGAWPLYGQPESLLACGPFGDRGDDFVGVPFPPEFSFPAADATLPGRGAPATVRRATRRSDLRRIELAAPPRFLQGAWYGCWRLALAGDCDGFLELDHDGDCQVFVDGAEVLRSERSRQTLPWRRYVGLHLPAGGHEVLVKTCSNGRSAVNLRLVDGEGHPLPGVTTFPATAPLPEGRAATTTAATFVTPDAALARAATATTADDAVRVAAVLGALREGDHDAAIDRAEGLRTTPPADPATALAWARVLRQVPLPDELRKAEARALEERAAAALLPAHHDARLAVAQHAEEQDRREEALTLLAAHPAPGPETFARRADVLRQVRFGAELVPLLEAWMAACPTDSRPLAWLANELQQQGASDRADTLRQQALLLRPDQPALVQTIVRQHAGLTRIDEATLAAAWPAFGGPVPLGRLRLALDVAVAAGDAAAAGPLRAAIAAHAETDVRTLAELAAAHAASGDNAAAVQCLQRARERGDDSAAHRSWLAQLEGRTPDVDELAAFRHDGKAAIAAFRAGEREQHASTTKLIDQQILLLQPDGSWTLEVHTLRRINDQGGVDAFGEKTGLGQTDEVMLLRTLTADGAESVPSRIDGDYSFQRLQPGSFVEWRYREHGDAPGAEVLRMQPFRFGDAHEPAVLAEFVVVLPTGRGELRTRGLGEPTRTAKLADGRTVHVHERRDVASLAQEQWLPGLLDLVPVAEVGEDLDPAATLRDQRVQLARRTRLVAPLRAAAAAAIPADAATPAARAAALWRRSQEVEEARADDALQTLLRGKGSRFLLATALFRAAGFRVVPVACRDVRPELATPPDSLFADDTAVQLPGAALELPDGSLVYYFADTPRHWPLGQVPASRVGSAAWLLRDDGPVPVVLPGTAAAAQSIAVRGAASVRGRDLTLTATIELGDVGGFGLAERLRQVKGDLQRQFARQFAGQLLTGWRIEQAQLAEPTAGQPLRLEVQCRRSAGQRDGERFVVPLPVPPTRFVASFGDREPRTLPWLLQVDMQTDWVVSFDPGPEHRLVALPGSAHVAVAPLDFALEVLPQGAGFTVRRHVRIGAAQRPAVAFGDWLRALGNADRAEQGTFVLVPRAAK